jgi:PAS domain-containing protein
MLGEKGTTKKARFSDDKLFLEKGGLQKGLFEPANDGTMLHCPTPKSLPDYDFLVKIINSIGDPIFVKDIQHRYIFINSAWTKLTGIKDDSIISKTCRDIFLKAEPKESRGGPPGIGEAFDGHHQLPTRCHFCHRQRGKSDCLE